MKNKLGKWLVGLSLALVVALVLSLGLASTLAVADTRIAVAKPVAVEAEYVYNGEEQTFGLVLPDGYEELYEVYGNKRKEAGNQHVTVRLKNPATHMWEDGTDADLDFIFSIGKATYDMSGVQFVNAEYTYDGTEKKVEVSGTLPSGVTVSYIANTRTDAGVSMAVATFSGDEQNYFAIPYMTASITVNKAEVAKPSPDTTEFVYDGTEKVYGVQENALWEIWGNKQTQPGQYTVAVSLKDKNNYCWADGSVDDVKYDFVIRATGLSGADDKAVLQGASLDPSWKLTVLESTISAEAMKLSHYNKVSALYTVELYDGTGAKVAAPNGTSLRLLIPEELRGKEFAVYTLDGKNAAKTVEFTVDGNYVVLAAGLGQFVFVYQETSLFWLIIVLAAICVLEILLLVLRGVKARRDRKVKTYSVAGFLFIAGLFSFTEVIVCYALLGLAVLLLIANIIAWSVRGKKKEEVEEETAEEETAEEETAAEEEAVAEEEATVEEPVVEEPVVEEPVAEEEPIAEEEVEDQPVEEEVIAEESVDEQPIVEDQVVEEEPVVEEQPVVEEPTVEEVVDEQSVVDVLPVVEPEVKEEYPLSYKWSFMAKLLTASPEMKDRYRAIYSHVKGFRKVNVRLSWHKARISNGRHLLGQLIFRGKTLCLLLALDPAEYTASKYHFKDLSAKKRYAATPMMLRLTSGKQLKVALELLDVLMADLGKSRKPVEVPELKHMALPELLEAGLVKEQHVRPFGK